LKKVWPEVELQVVPDAGHSSREIGTAKMLVEVGRLGTIALHGADERSKATDKFADLE